MLTFFFRKFFLVLFAWMAFSSCAIADTPVTLYDSYAGNVNFVGTQATRRTQSNAGNSCAVLAAGTTNTAVITGIPNTATIRSAHLYWAGSYSTQAGSTQTTPDYTVTFEGGTVSAPFDRRYTANYSVGTISVDFFSGVADVTTQVNTERNGTYSFSGLSVNTAAQHCSTASVLSGWSLVVIYEDAAEDFRVVNLFEGFQAFRGQSFTLIPDNFRIPNSPINGKHAHITWEGDAENSGTFNGFNERLLFNGTTLTDGNNPANNQFNSTSTIESLAPSTGANDSNSYGVDFDIYDISSLLSAGDTTATSTYSSGADLVILSSEIISVTNTPVSDLGITKTASSPFIAGNNATYNLEVNNVGPNPEPGDIVVTDTLPTGLSYVSATGTGWSCGAVGQTVTCTRTGNLAVGASTTVITLTVAVAPSAPANISNTASVSGTNFDNQDENDDSTATVTLTTGPNISLQKTTNTLFDPVNMSTNPKSIPGALAQYTISAINSGASPADNNSTVIIDSIPNDTALFVGDISGAGTGPVRFVDGTPPSGLSYNFSGLGNTSDNLSFSDDNGSTFTYVPSPDADGVDTNVTDVRISTLGQFLESDASGDPSFSVLFRVIVQ